MIYTVKSVREKNKSKKQSLVEITLTGDGGTKKYTLCEGTYREIGCPLSGDIVEGEALSRIAIDDERQRAEAKALSLLSFSDNSKSRLYMKLASAGFSRECAEYAVLKMTEYGYLDEYRQLSSLVLKYIKSTVWGRRKLAAKLSSLGYKREDISRAINERISLGEVDFDRRRRELIAAHSGEDREKIGKILYREGYDA